MCGIAIALLAAPPRILGQMKNRLPPSLPPEIHAWFAGRDMFAPEGFRPALDLFADHTNFGMLTTSIRSPEHEMILPGTRDQVKRAVEYAHQRGLRIALDLDIRLARGAFHQRHPEQQQWMLRLRSFPLPLGSGGRAQIDSTPLRDHMGQYQILQGRLMRVWAREPGGPRQLKEGCRVSEESSQAVAVTCESGALQGATELIVAAAFEYRTPDVFAPDFFAFQNEIIALYRDVPLDGAMKDEWGFPPVINQGPKDGDFWYSKSFAAEYAKAGGGEFLEDCLLMWLGTGGSEARRTAAVNRYMRLILTRNAAIERDFYETAKRTFGPQTFVSVHCTWGVMPFGDAFKNGYDWWAATRDYGQTDEHWPLPVRTSLAHKMGKPVWYNQYYAGEAESYATEVWRNARAGGRVNFHPLYGGRGQPRLKLLQSPAMQAETRVRLLNFITEAPLDCPVAVVFGHAAALNWVGGHFGDLGVDFAEDLWDRGIPADVIPSSEIASGALRIAEDGSVAYGVQRYRALVFVNPDYEPAATFDFLRRAARSKTTVFLRGRGGIGPDGGSLAESEISVNGAHADPTPSRVAQFLWNWHTVRRAAPLDLAKLTDGTCILARGEKNPAGDEIDESFTCGQTSVRMQATGVFGIRLARSGEVQGLAASGLRYVEAGNFRLQLSNPTDLALWRAGGEMHGVIQGAAGVPPELLQLTKDWLRLDVAPPPQ